MTIPCLGSKKYSSYVDLIAMFITFLSIYFWWLISTFSSLSISIKASDSWSNTPSALTERLTNLTVLKCFIWSLISTAYLDRLRSMLFLRLVSYPTVSSSMYRQLSLVVSSKSGRCLSPVIIDGLENPGRSTKMFWKCYDGKLLAIKFRIESCLQVNRFRPEPQPATTRSKVSGWRQKEHSDDAETPHLLRFLRVGKELLI